MKQLYHYIEAFPHSLITELRLPEFKIQQCNSSVRSLRLFLTHPSKIIVCVVREWSPRKRHRDHCITNDTTKRADKSIDILYPMFSQYPTNKTQIGPKKQRSLQPFHLRITTKLNIKRFLKLFFDIITIYKGHFLTKREP